MMKVLDVAPLREGLTQTISWLERLGTEMMDIDKTVTGIVALEDALKGEGGQAIRSFYEECHLPLLKFFDTFQQRFSNVLKSMNQAIEVLEPASTGFIREDFLEGEIEQGLRHIEQLTESLTNETNAIMRQVSDILALPPLDDSEVQFGVRNAKLKRDNTINQLHEFDASQTTALTPIEQDLRTMETWIVKLESLLKENLAGVHFQKTHWSSVTAESTLQTELAQRLMSVEKVLAEKTNPEEEPKNIGIEVVSGIGTGLFNVGKDLVVGTKDMIKDIIFHPVDTAIGLYQTAIHPIDTAEYVLTAISDSYERDVLNGDANSRAQWFSYAMGTIALTAGTRGISSAPKVGTIALKANAAKTVTATKNAINKPLLADYLPYSPQNRLAMVGNVPFNVMNGPVVKENLIVRAKVELDGKGTGKLNTDLAKAYLRDIEAKTGRKVNKEQIHLLKEALRNKNYEKLTSKETAKHRSKFTSSLKDNLIAEWEEKTNQKWPRYTKDVLDKNGEVARSIGQPYDAHHIIENNFGGPHEWWNIHPAKYPNEHQAGIHGKGAPSGKLFPRR